MKRTWALIIGVPALVLVLTGETRADYYVAQNGTNSNQPPYTSWATAASNIQDAVDQAVDLSTIWIGPGRYTASDTPPEYRGTNVVYALAKRLHFRGNSGDPADTVIDGEGKYRGLAVYFYNASPLVACRLQDLTFSNCLSAADNGGGVLFDSGTPDTRVWTGVVDNCVFVDNVAVNGGGISIEYKGRARVLIASNCVFRGNQATSGGAIYTGPGGAHRLVGCTIENNEASSSAGATYGGDGYGAGGTAGLMDRCIVRGNRATGGSACLFQYGLYSGHMTIRNSLFYDNYAVQRGIIYVHDVGLLDVENCTIVSNDVGTYGAIYMDMNPSYYVTCKVVNVVMYSNENWNIGQAGGETLMVSNSCSSHTDYIPDFAANNNITNNPRFANFAADNFRLGLGSPCIGTGTNLDWTADALDLDGERRRDVFTDVVDMGAYEYRYLGTMITIE